MGKPITRFCIKLEILFFSNLCNRITITYKNGTTLFVHKLHREVCKLKLQNHCTANLDVATIGVALTTGKNVGPPVGSHITLSLTSNISTNDAAGYYQILELRLELTERSIPCYIELTFPKSLFCYYRSFSADFNLSATVNIAVIVCKSNTICTKSKVCRYSVFYLTIIAICDEVCSSFLFTERDFNNVVHICSVEFYY